MNIETKLLNLLKAEQQGFALEALRRPQDKTEFEYGFRAGTLHGLDMSVSILLKILKDEKDGNNDM